MWLDISHDKLSSLPLKGFHCVNLFVNRSAALDPKTWFGSVSDYWWSLEVAYFTDIRPLLSCSYCYDMASGEESALTSNRRPPKRSLKMAITTRNHHFVELRRRYRSWMYWKKTTLRLYMVNHHQPRPALHWYLHQQTHP